MGKTKSRLLRSALTIGAAGVMALSPVLAPAASALNYDQVLDYSVTTTVSKNIINISPDIELTAETKAMIAEVNAKFAEIKNTLNSSTAALEAEIAELLSVLDQVLAPLKDMAGDAKDLAEEAIKDIIDEIRDLLTDYVYDSIYDYEYDPSVKTNAYNAALLKAQQDKQVWQAAVDEYEKAGGVVDQINTAAASANSAYNGLNAVVKGALKALLGIPDAGITTDWIISGATTVGPAIAGINCSSFPYSLAGATCTNIQTQIGTVINNLSDYQEYKKLLSEEITPEDFAADAAETADKAEKDRADGVAKASALAAGLLFDSTINFVEEKGGELIANLADKILEKMDDVKASIQACIDEIKGHIDVYYNSLLDRPSGLTLVSTTTVANTDIFGSNFRNLSWRDLLNFNFAIEDYGIELNTDDYAECEIHNIPLVHELTLESDWRSGFVRVDFEGSISLPEFWFGALEVNLPESVSIDVPGLGEYELPLEVLNQYINNFLGEYINPYLANFVETFSGREINLDIHRTFEFPDLNGLVATLNSTAVMDLYTGICDSKLLPDTGFGPSNSTHAADNSGASASTSGLTIISMLAIGVGVVYISRRRATRA